MRSLVSSVLICALLICHQGYAFNEKEDISDCLATLELDISDMDGFLIRDIKPVFFNYLSRASMDVNKKNCLAACLFQKAGIINPSGKFTDETMSQLYRDEPNAKVTACKDAEEFCQVGGCLLNAIFNNS